MTMVTSASEPALHSSAPADNSGGRRYGVWLDLVIFLFLAAALLVPTFGGPALGDHEALVAQCAREMRLSGDWLVPHYLGDPYVRKPPLPYWLIAGLSYVWPNDPATGLPVTTTLARLPSALAAMGTVLLLWKLAAVMFGRRAGRVAAVMGASSLFFLLYAANATVEMLLTFCCTWAHLHFWLGIQYPVGSGRRRLHLFFFYVAMGLGMMAKGPFPLVMVALPIAVWWYSERPLRMLARTRFRAWGPAAKRFFKGLWPRTVRAFRELWLIPGLVVFGLCFIPWMVAVGLQDPDAWDLWNWQYLQRAQGDYDDTRPRRFYYYLPIIAGLVLPWLFLIFEAIVSPWIRKYARQRQALLYVGLWVLVGTMIMSLIEFKKPYYVGPVIPALIMMMAVVGERFYSRPPQRVKPAWTLWGGLVLGGIALMIGGHLWMRQEFAAEDIPQINTLSLILAVAVGLLLVAGALYIRGRTWTALGMTAGTFVLGFFAVWFGVGQLIDNVDKVETMAAILDREGLGADDLYQEGSIQLDPVYWVERPDSRLSFYFDHYNHHIVDPEEVARRYPDRTRHKLDIALYVMELAEELLSRTDQVYLVMDREQYDLAAVMGMVAGTHPVGVAPDPDERDADWVIISNQPPRQMSE